MTPEKLLSCAQEYNKSIGTSYIIHIGRAGKLIKFKIVIRESDCFHLMGLHYLKDRPESRKRQKVFNDLLFSEKYRKELCSSELLTSELENRVLCTALLEKILDYNNLIIRYNPSRLHFYSFIEAEYLMSTQNYLLNNTLTDIYLFIDRREHSEEMYCKSIFPKGIHDYTDRQTIWHLLYKEKITPEGKSTILYKHKSYDPTISPDEQ